MDDRLSLEEIAAEEAFCHSALAFHHNNKSARLRLRLCAMARRSLALEEALVIIRDGTGAGAASLVARAALTPAPSGADEGVG